MTRLSARQLDADRRGDDVRHLAVLERQDRRRVGIAGRAGERAVEGEGAGGGHARRGGGRRHVRNLDAVVGADVAVLQRSGGGGPHPLPGQHDVLDTHVAGRRIRPQRRPQRRRRAEQDVGGGDAAAEPRQRKLQGGVDAARRGRASTASVPLPARSSPARPAKAARSGSAAFSVASPSPDDSP